MARIVVAGGGICGMAAALMLRRDGHDVVVLDRDPGSVPDDVEEAWAWQRRGVGQFRLAHLLLAAGYQVLVAELPDVPTRLRAAGGFQWNALDDDLARIPGASRRDGDDRFATVTARRPVIEWALATSLDAEPGVDVRRGVAIEGLVTGSSVVAGVPHVVGVRLAGGEEVRGDLVIDATGRRSPTPDWLAAIDARSPDEHAQDIGFTYTGRFFRSPDGSLPDLRTAGLWPCGSISLLTIPSDNGTWSATVYTASNDAALRRVRDPDVFERVWRAFPDHGSWLDGEPINDLVTMSGTVDRTRRFVVDDEPVVTGMLTVGDAQSCTNPSIGRGMSIGLMHTAAMRRTVREHLDDPEALARVFDAVTEAELRPWHDATVSIDRGRMAEIRAAIDGVELEASPEAAIGATLAHAATLDEDAARWMSELRGCLTRPDELFSRPGVFERVLELAGELPPTTPYGPDRRQLLELIS